VTELEEGFFMIKLKVKQLVIVILCLLVAAGLRRSCWRSEMMLYLLADRFYSICDCHILGYHAIIE
jgi:hypothetical protein